MKLIDMLVEDGMNGWQWPNGVKCITQDYGSGPIYRGVVFGYREEPHLKKNIWLANNDLGHADVTVKRYDAVADDWATAIITREQYEAALAAKDEGWIEWGGGECPVEEGVLVDVKYRDGDEFPDALGVPALSGNGTGSAFWERDGYNNDIISYRLHKPQQAEQPEASEEDLNECIGQNAAPVWSGEGQPPVGVECEYSWAGEPWASGVIRYISKHTIIIETQADSTGDTECAYHPTDIKLRPFRTEADRKRDEAVKAIMLTGWCQAAAEEIYDLVAAGKVPGMKLED
jgi:hypothetical protein